MWKRKIDCCVNDLLGAAPMYERFTDPARKAMQLANEEAQRFRHGYIGTEHILLGLLAEGSGVAATVLNNLGIDLSKIRLEVEKVVQYGREGVTANKLPLTPRAKKVIEYAVEEARSVNHNGFGTEHLLLGLLREWEGVAAQVLMNLGVHPDDVREKVVKLGMREPGSSAMEGPEILEKESPRFGARAVGRLVGRAVRAVGFGRWIGDGSAL
jgi:ATP-dependent Clp protease ATP-binding subunit ClpC